MRANTIVTIVALAHLSLAPRAARAGDYVWAEDTTRATYMLRYAFTLEAGVENGFDTWNLTPWADTVMHLMPYSNGECEWDNEVAYNDDCVPTPGQSDFRSCIYYVAPTTGLYCMIVYAFDQWSGGSGGEAYDLYWNRDGYPEVHVGRFDLGGFTIEKPLSYWETLETVLVNDGAAMTVMVRLVYNGNHYATDAFAYWNSVGFSSFLYGTDGSEKWVIATPYIETRRGPVRVLRNDAAMYDDDGDGLGNNLETELCTCPRPTGTVCGFNCANAGAGGQDTDGDGLRDDWEGKGVTQWLPDWSTGDNDTNAQLFPVWGADPRHKDVFVEVDYYGTSTRISNADAAWMSWRYEALTNQNNPDTNVGVSLHLDVGQDCETQDATHDGITEYCGNFGGSQVLTTDPGCTGATMDPFRVKKFHWGKLYSGEGGTSPGTNSSTFCWGDVGSGLRAGLPHELGHNLGLQHWGADADGVAERKPNYPSLMNYTYSNSKNGSLNNVSFSDGARAGSPLNPANLPESTPWVPSGTDISFMLYAQPGNGGQYGFSEQTPGSRLIDWNRDGEYTGNVRAHVCGEPHLRGIGLDQPMVQGSENVSGSANTTLGPGAAMLYGNPCYPKSSCTGYHTYVFIHDSATHRFMFKRSMATTGGWSTDWTNLGSETHHPACQPAAATFHTDAYGDAIVVFGATTASGSVRHRVLRSNGLQTSWSSTYANPPGVQFMEVSAAALGNRLYIVGRDNATGDVWHGWLNTQLAFQGWTRAVLPGSVIIKSGTNDTPVTPAIAGAPDGKLYMLTRAVAGPRSSGLALYSYDGALWAEHNEQDTRWLGESPAISGPYGRPAMVFRRYVAANGAQLASGNGALYVWWVGVSQQGDPAIYYRWTWGTFNAYVQNFNMGKWHWSDLSPSQTPSGCFGGPRAEAGVAVVDRAGTSAMNLTTFIPHPSFTSTNPPYTCPAAVFHVAHADGEATPPTVLNDHDDRPTIRDHLCTSLGNTVAQCTNGGIGALGAGAMAEEASEPAREWIVCNATAP
jgi:hypothetical protein